MDRLIAFLALAILAGFLGILAVWVQEPDLIIVICVTFALAAADVFRTLFGKR